MKKALLIAYRFPPQGGGGVQRTVKFVKHLSEFGWQPVVHTVLGGRRERDPEAAREVPAYVPVYHTWTWEVTEAEEKMIHLLEPSRQQKSRFKTRVRKILGALKRKLYLYSFVPDPQVLWVPFALVRSFLIAKREGVSLLYSTSPPHSSQILGFLLHRLLHLPWIVDFRDLWILSIHRGKLYNRYPWRQAVEEWWEKQIVCRASWVIVTTEKSRQELIRKYGSAEKFIVITNGFDPADFAVVQPPCQWNSGDFHLTLTGNVEALFDATPFFYALHELVQEDAEIARRLTVHFVGSNLTQYRDLIASLDLGGTVRVHAYVPHSASIGFLRNSDALFLCQIPDPISAGSKLSGKLFEYMAAKKPILALTLHESITAELLARFGPGVVVQPDDIEGIKSALRDLVRGTGKTTAAVNEEFVQSFDRRLLTADLAALMDQAVQTSL